MSDTSSRQPHAALNPEGRRPKAEKILRLLDLRQPRDRPLTLLEIGTGSGVIAHHIALQSGLHCDVEAVDVVDQRQVFEGFRFQRVEGTALPFADASFDAVISNHVIEHVGEQDAQLHHLSEIRRVMRPAGRAYLATPNRWQVVEPHYRIAFLSWLPKRLRSPYLRWRGKGNFYDCEPLTRGQLEAMLASTGLPCRNLCAAAIRTMRDIEPKPGTGLRLAARLPTGLLQALASISPTHIYLLGQSERRDEGCSPP
jgi:SAM-dependent methyltransferase